MMKLLLPGHVYVFSQASRAIDFLTSQYAGEHYMLSNLLLISFVPKSLKVHFSFPFTFRLP